MKHYTLYQTIFLSMLLSSCSTTSETKKEVSEANLYTLAHENVETTTTDTEQGTRLIKKADIETYIFASPEVLLTMSNLKTTYNEDFQPTLKFTVKNNTEVAITAFEVATPERDGFSKRFKTRVNPGASFTTSVKGTKEMSKYSRNFLEVSRVVFENGLMANVPHIPSYPNKK